jgi:hypothetical protein
MHENAAGFNDDFAIAVQKWSEFGYVRRRHTGQVPIPVFQQQIGPQRRCGRVLLVAEEYFAQSFPEFFQSIETDRPPGQQPTGGDCEKGIAGTAMPNEIRHSSGQPANFYARISKGSGVSGEKSA